MTPPLATLDANELAWIARRDTPRPVMRQPVTSADILHACAEYFHTTVEELTAPRRANKSLTTAYGVAIYLHCDLLRMRYKQIAKVFNRTHHAIHYMIYGIQRRLRRDPTLRRWVSEVEQLVSQTKG